MRQNFKLTRIEVPEPLRSWSDQMLLGIKCFEMNTGCSIIVSANEHGKWHLSIAHRRRLPTWEEIHFARYELVPDDVHMVMALPPKQFYLNKHKYCLHLWELHEMNLISVIEAG